MKKHTKEAGFTLVELLLSIALVGISIGVTSDVLISLIRSYNKTSVLNEIEQQSNFIALKIEKELRNAINITSDAPGAVLRFQTDAGYICYTVASSNIYRTFVANGSSAVCNTTAAQLLNSTPVSNQVIGGVSITCSGASGECFSVSAANPKVVGITMDFSQAASTGGASFQGVIKVENNIVIRNTY